MSIVSQAFRQFSKSSRSLRVATFNTLNTKDRYSEREGWLKENIYRLDADIIGLQECVFGPRSLDELMNVDSSTEQRHNLSGKPGLNLRDYTPHLAPVQLQLFEIWTAQPDPLARLDGNVIGTDKARFGAKGSGAEFEIISNEVLQVSGVRNCQMLTCRDTLVDKHLVMINLHLHNPMEKKELGDYLRAHQAEQMLHWLKAKQAEVDVDKIFVVGDFNTTPTETSYRLMKEVGFKSAYEVIHGEEPEWTFGTGL